LTGLNNFTSGAQDSPAAVPAPAPAGPTPVSRPVATENFKKPAPPSKGAPTAPTKKIDMSGFYTATGSCSPVYINSLNCFGSTEISEPVTDADGAPAATVTPIAAAVADKSGTFLCC
jgi:hypothetical protein